VLVIAFASQSLRAICENPTTADTELGPAVAQTLRNRLADLRAATSLSDLVAGSPRILNHRSQCMAVNLREGFQMIFAPNHVNNPRDGRNGIDWTKVRRIKIVEISR
jgi:hypothetical protein